MSNSTGIQPSISSPTDTYNIVICGEAGAGKSSLINLIAKTNVAVTSIDAGGCTSGTNTHEVLIQDETLKVTFFDTAGLGEGPEGMIPDKEARGMLKELLQTRMKRGDIHLVMYCVRSERVIRTLRQNYELIRSQVKKKVPIVLVVTCLELYKPDMEEWWRVNEKAISSFGMTFAGHACITTALSHKERRDQSYDAVYNLIVQCRVISRTAARKIRKSNGLLVGLLVGVLVGVLVGLLAGLRRKLLVGVLVGLFVGLLAGVLVGLLWKLRTNDMVSRLIKRCGMSPDVAKQLADRI